MKDINISERRGLVGREYSEIHRTTIRGKSEFKQLTYQSLLHRGVMIWGSKVVQSQARET